MTETENPQPSPEDTVSMPVAEGPGETYEAKPVEGDPGGPVLDGKPLGEESAGMTEAEKAHHQAVDDAARRQIPGYQIIERLGHGAMAVVFKARQLSLDRVVAIKVLPKKLSSDKEYVERFYSEGQAAARLNHPNIVQAIDVNEAHGYHYFVMEYVEGKTVYDFLQENKVYTEAEALNIIIQTTRALEHAHCQGLIHRDVKPKNIMITPDGVAKLMDMGLARVADDANAIAAEQGKLYGTPYYISPEQILGKGNVDFRCDIYSLGATLYHMVTGHVPFEAEDSKGVMLKHLKESLISPDVHNIDLSFGLVKIIKRMMAKHPNHRYGSTGELLKDLQSVEFLLEVDEPEGQEMPDLGRHMDHEFSTPAPPSPAPTPRAVGGASYSRPAPPPKSPANLILMIALAFSVMLNVILALLYWLG
jgi:serine/threonine-protein kinase